MIICPVCGADEVTAWPPELTEGDKIRMAVECQACPTQWVIIYTFQCVESIHQENEDADTML